MMNKVVKKLMSAIVVSALVMAVSGQVGKCQLTLDDFIILTDGGIVTETIAE